MADFNETLARLLKLTIGQDGYMDRQIERTVERTSITVEEYIDRRLSAGATGEEVLAELMADLDSDVSRIFGEFKTGMVNTVYGGANIAGTNGTVAQIIADTSPAERDTRLFRWQTNSDNPCEDCLMRHDETDTLEGWTIRGLPAQFGSRCTINCQCTLTATDVLLPVLGIGKEA